MKPYDRTKGIATIRKFRLRDSNSKRPKPRVFYQTRIQEV